MKISPEINNLILIKKKLKKKFSPIKRLFFYICLKIRNIALKKKRISISKQIDHNKLIVKKIVKFMFVVSLILKFVSKLKFRMSSRHGDLLTERSTFFINDLTNFAPNDPVFKNKWINNKKIQKTLSNAIQIKKKSFFFRTGIPPSKKSCIFYSHH